MERRAQWRRAALVAGVCGIMARATPAAAQDASAFGIVSEGGRPIVGVPVAVDGAPAAVTDEDGSYFVPVAAGSQGFAAAPATLRSRKTSLATSIAVRPAGKPQ